MKEAIKNLLDNIDEIIANSPKDKQNTLRFKIGEAISNFYTQNKDILARATPPEIDDTLKQLFDFYHVNHKFSEISKKSANWDKIRYSISEFLTSRYNEGYGITNIGYMLQFYRKYRNSPNIIDLANQLEWSHNVELLKDKLQDDERKYYLKSAISEKWTVSELKNQINNESYEDFLATLERSNYVYTIRSVVISNYKSLHGIQLENPSPFLVFAGANASGKSNIFEALEFLMHASFTQGNIVFDIFGGVLEVINYESQFSDIQTPFEIKLEISINDENKTFNLSFGLKYNQLTGELIKEFTDTPKLDRIIASSFSRIFIANKRKAENKLKIYNKLWIDGSNLSNILSEIFKDEILRNEINEWIRSFIPEIVEINVVKDYSGKEEIQIIEKQFPKQPFSGNLISEGTHNLIALLAIFYQTKSPQFICIEEPEIGLNPGILEQLVPFFREMVKKYRHKIWVTTHSTSLVAQLIEEELIIVTKKEGRTNVYPCKEGDFEELKPDEAWMSNMLKGGGLPW